MKSLNSSSITCNSICPGFVLTEFIQHQIDVIAKKDTRTLVAQCKRFMKPVGNKAVQEIVAGMKYYEATEGVVIAPNGYTNSAKNLAEANNIKLIHHS